VSKFVIPSAPMQSVTKWESMYRFLPEVLGSRTSRIDYDETNCNISEFLTNIVIKIFKVCAQKTTRIPGGLLWIN